jgi:hypothetical protein
LLCERVAGGRDKWLLWLLPLDYPGDASYRLYVPKGTIKEECYIDLE